MFTRAHRVGVRTDRFDMIMKPGRGRLSEALGDKQVIKNACEIIWEVLSHLTLR